MCCVLLLAGAALRRRRRCCCHQLSAPRIRVYPDAEREQPPRERCRTHGPARQLLQLGGGRGRSGSRGGRDEDRASRLRTRPVSRPGTRQQQCTGRRCRLAAAPWQLLGTGSDLGRRRVPCADATEGFRIGIGTVCRSALRLPRDAAGKR